jgi:hypothetical protein
MTLRAPHPVRTSSTLLDAVARAAIGERRDKAAVPIEDRAASVEGEHLDPAHPRFLTRAAHARCRHHEIAGNQLEPLVFAG